MLVGQVKVAELVSHIVYYLVVCHMSVFMHQRKKNEFLVTGKCSEYKLTRVTEHAAMQDSTVQ